MPTAVIGDEKYLIDSYIRSGKLLHLHSRVQLHLKERPPASHQGCREGEGETLGGTINLGCQWRVSV